MQISEFNATCPYEIGDLIYLEHFDRWSKISDIICEHSIKHQTVKFKLIIDSVNRIDLNQVSIYADSPTIQKTIPNNEVEARRSEWDKD